MALVLYYDPFDKISYAGEPTSNLFSASYALGSNLTRGAYQGKTSSMELIANPFGVPFEGATVNAATPISKTEYYNIFPSGSYDCCPAYFLGATVPGIKPSTTYTFSQFYKVLKNDYNHPNHLYVYQYSSSGYIREDGIFTTTKRIQYPNGWWRCWGSLTTHVSCSYVILYSFNYEYYVRNHIWLMAPQFEEKSHMTEYTPVSRSTSQGLKDISGYGTPVHADLTNANYDNNQNLYFYTASHGISFGANSTKLQTLDSGVTDFTYECWWKCMGTPVYSDGHIFGRPGFNNGFTQQIANNWIVVYLWYSDGTPVTSTAALWAAGNLYHLVMTVKSIGNQREMKFYVNGQLISTTPLTKGLRVYGATDYVIGNTANIYIANGKYGVCKMYNHAISDVDVAQNYKMGLFKHSKL